MRPQLQALRQVFASPKVADTRSLDVELIGLALLMALVVVGHLITGQP